MFILATFEIIPQMEPNKQLHVPNFHHSKKWLSSKINLTARYNNTGINKQFYSKATLKLYY